jgi:peptide/nickel transport system permease protein
MRVADLVMTIPGLPLLIVAGAMLSELDFSRTRASIWW